MNVSAWIPTTDQGGRLYEKTLKDCVVYNSNKWHQYTPRLPMNNQPSSRIKNLLFPQQRPKTDRGWLQTYFGCDPCAKAWTLVGVTGQCMFHQAALEKVETYRNGTQLPTSNSTGCRPARNPLQGRRVLTIFRNKERQSHSCSWELSPPPNAHQIT